MSRGHVGVERAPRRRRRRERYDELAAWADARGYDDRHLLARVRGADAQVTSWSSSMRTDNLREGTRNVASIASSSTPSTRRVKEDAEPHRERRRGRRRGCDRRDGRRRRRLRPGRASFIVALVHKTAMSFRLSQPRPVTPPFMASTYLGPTVRARLNSASEPTQMTRRCSCGHCAMP